MATLAAILVVVAYHMSEWRTVRAELRGAPRTDAAVMLATLGLTVFVDLSLAIAVGMVLAAFLFMKRMAETASVSTIATFADDDPAGDEGESSRVAQRARVPRDVAVYDINGPFFFGAAEKFRDALGQVSKKPRALILDMENVPVIDSTGLRALGAVVTDSRKRGVRVLLADLDPRVREAIMDAQLGASFGPGELELTFDQALFVLGPTGEMPTGEMPAASQEGGGRRQE
jgi:SulP family sulfate permease